MSFDDYSTSFQSLYSPMYNLQTNYSAIGGTGTGIVKGGMGMGYPMGIYNGSLSNVGIGQFGADQLVKNDQARNNYYARPIAPHKTKNDVPTILGIIGTALGTAAVLLALRKGKAPAAANTATAATTPNVVRVRKFVKAPYSSPVHNVDPSTLRYAPSAKPAAPTGAGTGATGSAPIGAGTGATGSAPTGAGTGATGSAPIGAGTGATGSAPTGNGIGTNPGINDNPVITGAPIRRPANVLKDHAVDTPYEQIGQNILGVPSQTLGLPAPGNGGLPALVNNRPNLKSINEYLPKDERMFTLPNNRKDLLLGYTPVKGYLPRPEDTRYGRAVAKQQASMNLPSENLFKDPDILTQTGVSYSHT